MIIENRSILQPFIIDGKVNYKLLKNGLDLDQIVTDIEETDVRLLSRNDQLAFYLNAYNFITLKSVLHRLHKNPQWQGNTSMLSKLKFFMLERHVVAGRKMSLYHLENKILRKQFADPRIHFAINCASVSCPSLPGFMFTGANLDDDLEQLTFDFINSDEVMIVNDQLLVNPIFKWYKADFQPSITEFISQYRPVPSGLKLKFGKYNWRLNST